ncbi:MAG: hypothetical protein EHM45_05695 [Desulfobacteraceae bacterium]|nr:MAG: hypothetical protein EHM45_05695 [Desulfobacteraceae bacterium]
MENYIVIIVVVTAFFIGYAVVGFIMKKIKELNSLPKWNERHGSDAEKKREQNQTPKEPE